MNDVSTTPTASTLALATEDLPRPTNIRSLSITGLLLLALLYTAYFAAALLIPIVVAFLVHLLLSPVSRALARLRVPSAFGAVLILVSVAGLSGAGMYSLSGPAAEWVGEFPEKIRRIEYRLRSIKEPLEKVQKAATQAGQLTEIDSGVVGTTQPVQVVAAKSSLSGIVLNGTPSLIASLGVFFVLLYFLLATHDVFLNKLVRAIPKLSDRKTAVEIVRTIERDIASYLTTVSLISCVLGVTVSLAMWAIGVSNPVLWGVLATALNFAPYLGPTVMTVLLTMVGLSEFEDPARSLMVPLAYVLLTLVEGNLITPIILSRRLMLSPVVVFLSIVLWGWLWGPVGALLAVPMLVSLKIVLERIEPLRSVADFMGR